MKNSLIKKIMDRQKQFDSFLSKYATRSNEAIRIINESNDIRNPFSRDGDRIVHALSYTRYSDKTQVYSFQSNTNISKRIVHVQLVSKIARTIGRSLGLNEDLIEAIALGHDIGHPPLGHLGEKILDNILYERINMHFFHNIQSVRDYLRVENNGKGLNLTIQVLDGIMCHNGEMLSNIYRPRKKSIKTFLKEYHTSYVNDDILKKLRPMTLEGCVVRISDVIAYIGRDIEDAVNLGKFNYCELPKDITDVVGSSNREIVNSIVLDIIENSYNKPYIKLSSKMYETLNKLKDFNYHNIYYKSNDYEKRQYYKDALVELFNKYLDSIKNNDRSSSIYQIFLYNMSSEYLVNTSDEQKVIDFISGMTDNYFLSQYEDIKYKP